MTTPKSTRATAEETRTRLLDAAAELLNQHGAPPRLDHVSLEHIIKITGVPRSSAYSAWEKVREDHTPQETFRRALIKRVIRAEGLGTRDLGPLRAILPYVQQRIRGLPPIEQRRELVRLVAGEQFHKSFTGPGYRVSLALTTASISAPSDEVDQEVLGWLRETEAAWLGVMIETFQGLAAMVNVVPAPEYDSEHFWQMFTSAVLALGEGLFGRMSTSQQSYLVEIPGPGPNGTTEMWTLYALALDAIVDRFFVTAEG